MNVYHYSIFNGTEYKSGVVQQAHQINSISDYNDFLDALMEHSNLKKDEWVVITLALLNDWSV